MRRKYSRLLTFIIAFSMILSMHVTFAVPDYENFDGNDSFTYKQNSSSSSTWYFDEDGNKVGGPTDYWVKFTVSGDELSFKTNNLSLDLVSIKGGPMYRVYTNLGSSESGLTAPLNESGNEPYEPYGISHYSFELDKIIPPPPPEKADVRVEKSIEDMDDGESLAGFKFELWQAGAKVYGPETTNSSGFALFEDVEPGTYDVMELLTGGQSEIYEPEGDVTVTVDEGEEGLVTVSFENTKIDEPEMPKVKVIKKIELKTDQEIMISSVVNDDSLAGFEFELWKDGSKVYGPKTTNSSGFAIFDDVEPGTYYVVEFLTAGQQEMYEPEEDVTVTVDVDEEGTVEVTFTNYKIPADDELGSLIVHKRIMRENGSIVGALQGGEFTVKLTGPNDYDEEKTINGPDENGEHVIFDDLPFGTYTLSETKIVHEGKTYGDPIFATSGNKNYTILNDFDGLVYSDTTTIEIDSEGQEVIWLINVLEDEPPPPELGEIVISKTLVDEDEQEITDDDTEFEFTIERYVEGDWVEIEESPVFLAGGESETLEDLPLGLYRVTEDEDLPDGYTRVSSAFVEVTLSDDGDIEDADFTNMREDDTPPPPELGEIVISKTLVDEDEQEITDDDTEFEFMIEIYDDVLDVWVEIDDSPVFLAGGESETLEDLPLGLYRVTEDEDLPDGYTRVSSAFVEVTLSDDGDSEDADFTNMREDDTPPPPELGEIEVTKRVLNRSGNVFSSTAEFFFELQVAGEGGWVTIDDGSIIGNGSLTFEDLDDGEYRVREVSINSAYFLVTNNNLEVDIVEASSEDVEFTNRLRPIDDDDNDDDDNDDDDDDDNNIDDDDDDEDDPVIESVTVTPDPVPQAPPVIEVVETEPEPEPEMEVIEEPVPQATLPRTGASDPSVFAGFGAAFMALGAFLKRKKF